MPRWRGEGEGDRREMLRDPVCGEREREREREMSVWPHVERKRCI